MVDAVRKKSMSAHTLAVRVKALLDDIEAKTWAAADLVAELQDRHRWTLHRIGAVVGRKKAYLSQLAKTARAFPPALRRDDIAWHVHHLTRLAVRKTALRFDRYDGKAVGEDYSACLNLIAALHLHKARDIGRAVVQYYRKRHLLIDQNAFAAVSSNNCHNMDCRDLIATIDHANIWHIDPPYSNYERDSTGGPGASGAEVMSDTDNADATIALAVTVDVLRLVAPKVQRGDVILLWQSSNAPLRRELLDVLEEGRLAVDAVVTWNKPASKLGDGESAWMLCSELLYIIKRRGARLRNWDNSSDRSNVIHFAPVRMDPSSVVPQHSYQKPREMSEFLIKKHSATGGLVVDLFGCTGSFCHAAIATGRSWIYCESNDVNFATFAPALTCL